MIVLNLDDGRQILDEPRRETAVAIGRWRSVGGGGGVRFVWWWRERTDVGVWIANYYVETVAVVARCVTRRHRLSEQPDDWSMAQSRHVMHTCIVQLLQKISQWSTLKKWTLPKLITFSLNLRPRVKRVNSLLCEHPFNLLKSRFLRPTVDFRFEARVTLDVIDNVLAAG